MITGASDSPKNSEDFLEYTFLSVMLGEEQSHVGMVGRTDERSGGDQGVCATFPRGMNAYDGRTPCR